MAKKPAGTTGPATGETVPENMTIEKITVQGEQLIKRIKQIIKAGNTHSMTISEPTHGIHLRIPLNSLAVAIVVGPALKAAKALRGITDKWTIAIVKEDSTKTGKK